MKKEYDKFKILLFIIIILLTIIDLVIAIFIDYLYSIGNIKYKIVLFAISLLPFLISMIYSLILWYAIRSNKKWTIILFIIRFILILPIILFFIFIMFFSFLMDDSTEDISVKKDAISLIIIKKD